MHSESDIKGLMIVNKKGETTGKDAKFIVKDDLDVIYHKSL